MLGIMLEIVITANKSSYELIDKENGFVIEAESVQVEELKLINYISLYIIEIMILDNVVIIWYNIR